MKTASGHWIAVLGAMTVAFCVVASATPRRAGAATNPEPGRITAPAPRRSPDNRKRSLGFRVPLNTLDVGTRTGTGDAPRYSSALKADVVTGIALFRYHGLNRISGTRRDSYFGRHRVMGSVDGGDNFLIYDFRATSEDLFRKSVGWRNYSLPRSLGLYGHLNLAVGEDFANSLTSVGKNWGTFSVDIVHTVDFLFDSGERPNATEIQALLPLRNIVRGDGLTRYFTPFQLFVLYDTRNLDIAGGRFSVGIEIDFGKFPLR